MLLTLSSSAAAATDLGFLLHKHPDRVHEKELGFGVARVCYPEATDERCTAALIVDVDPVRLVRDGRGPARSGFALAQYVNDRPYAASSFLCAAMTKMFGTAMSGRSKDRPDLVDRPLPLTVRIPVLPCRGGEDLLRRLFEPLAFAVSARVLPLDPQFPAWGDSRYVDVTLETTATVKDVLERLLVLLPVLDDDKHYWVGEDEIDKLLRRGGDWLVTHPERELITRRYLRHDRQLTSAALARLVAAGGDTAADPDEQREASDAAEAEIERPVRLNDQRLAAVVGALGDAGARRIADLGCGQGNLVRALLREPWVERVAGIDVAWRALEVAARRLRLDTMPPRQRARVELWHGALTYRDRRLQDFDAIALVEVIEHVDLSRLGALEDVVFAAARPRTVVVTTPNVEHNALFPGMEPGQRRHRDHRFEWTRAEFAAWTAAVAGRHGYTVALSGIGADDPDVGAPTQMAVFRR